MRLLLLLLFLLNYSASAQIVVIEWEDRRCLEWDDFSGSIDENSFKDIAAVSCLKLDYFIECGLDSNFHVDATAVFIPECSWVRPIGKTEYILNHEQRHFDISRIYADKLEFVCNTNPIPCDNDKLLTTLIEMVLNEWQMVQKLYDSETIHSIDTHMQNTWD